MIICTCSNGFLDEDILWTLFGKIGRVRDIALFDCKCNVYFEHVWEAQRASAELNNMTFDGIKLYVSLPEPTRALWAEMRHVSCVNVERRFGSYGVIEALEMYEEGIVIQYESVECAISALVLEQDVSTVTRVM